MDKTEKIPVTADELREAIKACEVEEKAAHDRGVVLAAVLRARVRYDAQRAEADKALAERVAAAGRPS